MKPLWTLETALGLIQELAPSLKAAGYYPALTGSLLYPAMKGTPPKDLDLILYPSNAVAFDRDAARAVLTAHDLQMSLSFSEIQSLRRRMGTVQDPEDTKHVEVWTTRDRRRIDVFFLA